MDDTLQVMAGAHGPFASVYLPPGVADPGWPAMRGTLIAQDIPAAMLAALDDAVRHGASGTGRALIATSAGLLVDGPVAWAPAAPIARLSDLPYLLPLVPKHAARAAAAQPVMAGAPGPAPGRPMFDQFVFECSRPDGPVVQGLPDCVAALRDHNADALVVTENALADRAVWVGGTHRDQVAVDSADLRAVGMPANHQRADEAVPMAALAIGADLVVAEAGLPLVDGIGVLLRHPW